MITMTSTNDRVAAAAASAGLTEEQTLQLRNIAASWAMEGMTLPDDELSQCAEIIAGRLSGDEVRRRLNV